MAYLFALGFISILGQVVLLRELNVAFYGVELIYTLALAVWLVSTAVGSIFQRKNRSAPAQSWTNALFLLFSIGLPSDVALVRGIRHLFTDVPGAYLPLGSQVIALCIILLPIGLILGLLFRWTAGSYIANGKTLARAYAVESIGGLAGGVCATLLLKFGFQNFVIALMCSLVAAGASIIDFDGRRFGIVRSVSLGIVLALLLLVWKAPVIDHWMTSWNHPNLLAAWDSPYSRITATYLDGQVSIFENDALLFDTEATRAEEFVHIAALQHFDPRRVLVLGGGIEGTIREILQHSPQRVDYVELNPALLRFVPQYLPPEIKKSLQRENVRVIQDDPRNFLEKSLQYDLILVGMPEPGSGQANRFYTQEFFRQCNSKLDPGGIMAFSLPSSENLWTPQLTRRMASIYKAAKSVFSEVLFIPGTMNVVIGSNAPLTGDPSVLSSRLEEREIRPRLVSAAYLRYVFTNDRLQQVAKALDSGVAPINSDARPICYQYTTMIWLSKFLPALKSWNLSIPSPHDWRSIAWLVALSIPALLLSRTRWPIRRALLTGAAGFSGMTLETVVLLHFQTKSGILYQDIGILLTGFMAGLAFGSLGLEKTRKRPARHIGFIMLAAFVAISGICGWCINSGWGYGLLESLVFLFASGALVGGIFSYAGLREPGDQTGAVAPLYSADLIGGCLGSVLATLILAPLAGLAVACYLMIPVILLSALLL